MQRYQTLIEKIARVSGLSLEDVEKKVEAKKLKLSGLISKEGAAQIISAELGIIFEDQDSKINELLPGLRKVNVVGKVTSLYSVREYEKNGRSGKVANFFMADETGSVRVVLWDVNHIKLIEDGKIVVGSVVEIKNASMRESEVHLSGFSEIKLSKQEMENVSTEKAGFTTNNISLNEARPGQNVMVRGIVVQVFQPRFYLVCPECNKKVNTDGEKHTCAEHGKVIPKQRAIVNFVVDDGTESMRVVVFSDQIKSLINEEDLQDINKATVFRDELLGTELYVSGPVRINKLFNNLEIISSNLQKVDLDKLIKELEA
jgi:replication factor A1